MTDQKLSQTRLIRLNDVRAKTGLSRSAIYQAMKDNKFPQAVNIGSRSVGWVEYEIDSWIRNRMATRRPVTNCYA